MYLFITGKRELNMNIDNAKYLDKIEKYKNVTRISRFELSRRLNRICFSAVEYEFLEDDNTLSLEDC